jgi:hypothetical protein
MYTVQCIPVATIAVVILSCVLCMGTAYVYTIGIMAVAAPLIVVPVAQGSSVPDVV